MIRTIFEFRAALAARGMTQPLSRSAIEHGGTG